VQFRDGSTYVTIQ